MHPPMKVGDLARQTGLSVRTLHYYEEIGLLRPSHRTAAGHRLYTAGDIARLQQIVSLRELGFSLEQIRGCLEDSSFSPLAIIEQQMTRVREQIILQQQLHARLEGIATYIRAGQDISVEQFLQTIEVMTMIEKYYTPEQLAELSARREALGEDAMRDAEAAWRQLYADVRAEMDKGTDPASEPVQALVRRWRELINAFTGGNQEIEKSLHTMYKQEGTAMLSHHGFDPAVAEYMAKAKSGL